MNNILLLTDFTDLSEFAKNLSAKISFGLNAKLHVLNVVEVSSEVLLNDAGEILPGMGGDISSYEKQKKEAEAQIEDWKSNLPGSTQASVKYGQLTKCVSNYIKEEDIDLVIMGMHSISGLKEKLSGSVTQQVILDNRVPVLSLKCDRSDLDFSDFLITGDFESKQKMNFEVLRSLQKVFNSTFHLLCVNTKHKFKSTSESIKCMKEFAEMNGLENVEFHIHNDSSVEEGIMNFANNYDANHNLKIDIIAVEKKDKSTLEYWFTGCAAIDYVNHIYRPIITYLSE